MISKRVTIPKLFVPPLRATKRSELKVALASVIVPLASTIWKSVIESHAKPRSGEKNDMPPKYMLFP